MKSSIQQMLATGLLAFAFTASLSACNAPTPTSFLNSMDLAVTQSNGESYITLTSTFTLGNVSLASVEIPVQDPKTMQNVGTIAFSQLPNGQGQISLNVNASVIANADATLGTTLPNGNGVPLVLGTQYGDMLGIPVLSNSRVYVGGDLKHTIYAGVAFGIPGLDQVMAKLGTPVNIFFTANFGTNIVGVGGVYGSSTANENGIAVFGEYTANAVAQIKNLTDAQDQQLDHVSPKIQKKLLNFFFGAPRKIQLQ